jgi:transketolase
MRSEGTGGGKVVTLSEVEMRDAFIGELCMRAQKDANIIFLSNDFGAPSLDQFRKEFPRQFINVGISEQNIISVAAGMALQDKRVFVYSIASFITLRCYEQIKIDLCAMNLPVAILGVGSCYGYGPDGPTHHATEDIAIMRSLANMSIYSPADAHAAESFVALALGSTSPVYIRLDKGKWPLLYDKGAHFSEGFAMLREGGDVGIVATGIMTHRALEVAEELAKNFIHASVIDVYRLKPIQPLALLKAITRSQRLVTIEEHSINGGLGSLIDELLADASIFIPVKRCAVPDELLYAYGTRDILHFERRLDKDSLVRTVDEWVHERSESSQKSRYSERR